MGRQAMISTAAISECGLYRYELRKIWQPKNGWVCWIMLNPSTADANIEDPTIRRCMGFAEKWGYGGITVGNIFAYRATNPKDMFAADDPYGPENNSYLKSLSLEAELTICAWGNHGMYLNRASRVVEMLTNPYHLGLTMLGQPKHPLYLKGDLKIQPFTR